MSSVDQQASSGITEKSKMEEDRDNRPLLPPSSAQAASADEPETKVSIENATAPTKDSEVPPATIRSRVKKCLFCSAWIYLILVLLAAFILLAILLIMVGGRVPKVLTDCGVVEGQFHVDLHAFSFKGIPYAQPPIEHRRWKRPKPLEKQYDGNCWKGTLKATEFQSQCAQLDSSSNIVGEEDCLYLNVFTPNMDSDAQLSVMVYIHGGALRVMNASYPGYSPSEALAAKLNVVFVSFTYRLDVFGFLSLDVLGDQANYGFWDQHAALQWVQGNIHAFGGDKNKVTLFGQSSGGTSVLAQLASSQSVGLFSKAWVISAGTNMPFNKSQADQQNHPIMTEVNCDTASCLRNISSYNMLKAADQVWYFDDDFDLPVKDRFSSALAVVDGIFLQASPLETLKSGSGNFSDVPLLIGYTAQETDALPGPGEAIKTWKRNDFENYVTNRLNPFRENLGNDSLTVYGYDKADPVESYEYMFTTMSSDIRISCGQNEVAREASQTLTNDVFMYIAISWPSSPARAYGWPFDALYAFHGWDTNAFFDQMSAWLSSYPDDMDREFQNQVTDNVMNFVKTGKPKDPNWKPVANNTARLSGNTIQFVDVYHKKECQFWMNESFLEQAWIN